MGAFFTSIQVRTSDREAVKSAVAAVTEKMKIRCLLGPELGGWVGMYPEDKTSDDEFDSEIASRVSADVLTLIVHDDDVLFYRLFRDGKLVDVYCSNPEFSDPPSAESGVGRPELFAPLTGGDTTPISALLDRGKEFTFESRRLAKLAKLLGIQNAATSFDYLESGERAGVKHWKKFEQIPPESKPVAAEKPPSANAIRKKFTKSGVLIYCHEWKGFPELLKGYAVGGGFVLGSVNPWQKISSLSEFLPPEFLPRPLPPDADRAAAVVQGRFAVIDDRQSTRVLDAAVSPWTYAAEIQKDDRLRLPTISPDGELIAHSNALKVVVSRLPGGDILAVIPMKGETSIRKIRVGGKIPVTIGNIRGIEQPGCVGFSRDGRYFWCGTNVNLRIYDWESLISDSNPKKGWQIAGNDVLPSFTDKQITAIAEDVDGSGVVFATHSGKLGRFDLRTAELHRLMVLPGGGQVQTLLFSADGKTLAVGSERNTNKKPRGMPNYTRAWEIWNYEKLRQTAELRGQGKQPEANSG